MNMTYKGITYSETESVISLKKQVRELQKLLQIQNEEIDILNKTITKLEDKNRRLEIEVTGYRRRKKQQYSLKAVEEILLEYRRNVLEEEWPL